MLKSASSARGIGGEPLPSNGQNWGNYPLIGGCSQPGTFTA
ncbi:hypothetical protein MCEMSHM24_01866 [Comamonadaceae bacterium]